MKKLTTVRYFRDLIKKIYVIGMQFGIDPRKTAYSLAGVPFYFRDLIKFYIQKNNSQVNMPFAKPDPILSERFVENGHPRGHYFHQDLLVARRIFSLNPYKHVDVGSRMDGFIAHVASFRSIEVFDIRNMTSRVPNVTFVQADMMEPIHDNLKESIDSLSCLHALEHFGLGRYNDPVCFDGHVVGFNNIYRLLKPGGKLYFSVPIGSQRVEFNAHRVFSMVYLIELFGDRFLIDYFSYVNDKGDLIENAELTRENIDSNFGCYFGCGIFEMTKL